MSELSVEFTKENIDLYFKELSKEYKKLGGRSIPVEIILIGGAAVVENYGFRNMTTDIDAIIPTMEIIKDAINRVGDKFGLPSGWLNSDFMKTSSYSSKLAEYSVFYKTFNQVLNVRYISGEYLIAMKLKSGREYKNDLSDIIGILAEQEKQGKPITLEEITIAVNNLYGNINSIDKKSILFINAVFENKKYEEIYETIRENEKNTKSVLISFDEKYPGVLSDDNVDFIIDNEDKKSADRISLKAMLEKLKKDRQIK